MTLRAGFAVTDISPPLGLPMGGYAARVGVAEGALDPLQCRAAVFAGAGSAVAIIVLDLLYVAGPWATALRRRIASELETEPSSVLVAATHTHSGPAVFSPGASTVELAAYERQVADAALGAARAARAALEPCVLQAGEAPADGVGASRREATSAVAQSVRVLVARRADDSCAGIVASFACHPTILPPANLLYSRDLFGAAVDLVQAEVGAPVLLCNGAAADVSTRFTRREATSAEVRRLGARLGAAIVSAVRGERGPRQVGEQVSGRSLRLPIEVTPLADDAEATRRMTDAAAALEELRSRGASTAEQRLAASRLEGAMARLFVARQGGWSAIFGRVPHEAEVQELRLGDHRVLAVPGEMFSAVGQSLCAGGGRLLVGYANDYLGYLVPPELAGDGEYEASMAMLSPASAAAVAAALGRWAAHV